ncbi:ribosomal protein S18-alanine N-acetyltransferase [Vulgatibacter sp.]|uniref:ribosomal protein S18-alanine N-acetyltransferase n=1 Tax=Vulgatibacter sp. TaxID=1971226 RepID=UPI00356B228C
MRRMVAADVEPVMEVERRAFKNPWSEDLFRRELTHDWSTILLALEPGTERVLGFVIFWVVHDEIHILNVAVDPPARRRGVARALLEELLQRGRRQKLALATLEVRKSNTGAIALYEGLGFRAVGVRKGYYVDEGEDAIVMVLDL